MPGQGGRRRGAAILVEGGAGQAQPVTQAGQGQGLARLGRHQGLGGRIGLQQLETFIERPDRIAQQGQQAVQGSQVGGQKGELRGGFGHRARV